ncbi:FAD-dependent oxidoreductase [Defluviimonas sp. 20V17]|uniref:FAD-dependent oxidoreductase n=1 Tax=Allgaiera indica TaxID=765699 RepID=A0AAN4UN27_9RHOB|nr:tRNA (5-methylaminomethyl-2-thiouridine)(34)-methyltransferase MnmD [Allgaiera indica]KDB03577.1 FAD-dependent oxidoreductase [Defluviimonas sp. 20V17]GHD98356.1 FAD-dependent oxidoreductase [Allgaiera indica]SDW48847.1 tRNA U34 5-methylaminomethyl-2-thiouridine-forming methyltransferase MnmC [Allgaiera indica]
MQRSDQSANLTWRDGGVPVSTLFDDPYFSLAGGLEETRHVFLQGNDLPARFRPGFHIAELGFGTGLNLIAALLEWRAAGCKDRLYYTSFEAFPMTAADMSRALEAFPAARAAAEEVLAQWAAGRRVIELPDLRAEIVLGDARETLPRWGGRAEAWFLDGFSPAKNPEMWAPGLMAQVAAHTARGGSFASYTAAGFVRRGLQEAGFAVTRVPGYGRKRHMSRGVLKDSP